jgi:hypothetical protein
MSRFYSQPLHLAESGYIAGHGQKHAYLDGFLSRGRETLHADCDHKESNQIYYRPVSAYLTVWLGDGVVQNPSFIRAIDKM